MSHEKELGLYRLVAMSRFLLAVFPSFHESQSFAKDQKFILKDLNIVSMFPTDQTLIKVHVIKPPTILDNPPGIIEVNSMYSRI